MTAKGRPRGDRPRPIARVGKTRPKSRPIAVSRALVVRHMDRMVKVLIPTELRRFDSNCPGHRALHFAGDWRLGAGLLVTRPVPTRADLKKAGLSRQEIEQATWVEADYVSMGDWVIYAAPNEFTNPYVIDVRSGSEGRKLGRTLEARARALLAPVRTEWVDQLRREMPFNACARCQEACDLFRVSDEEWARVGPRWRDKVLCRDCYDALTSAPS
jgi:hypothetical protein